MAATDSNPADLRVCTKCSMAKPLSAFYWQKRRQTHETQCKACRLKVQKSARDSEPEKFRARVEDWKRRFPERNAAAIRAWHERNPDRTNAATRRWRIKNSERQKALTIAWRARNVDRVFSQKAAWRAANKDRAKVKQAEWRAANPELVRLHVLNRRARILRSTGRLSRGLAERLLRLQKGRCAACGEKLAKFHMDHVVPLARGGENRDENIQLLCRACNHSKHAKSQLVFMRSRGYLL
jgi:5-methylcytosine-specific restriction endonuclease McrA